MERLTLSFFIISVRSSVRPSLPSWPCYAVSLPLRSEVRADGREGSGRHRCPPFQHHRPRQLGQDQAEARRHPQIGGRTLPKLHAEALREKWWRHWALVWRQMCLEERLCCLLVAVYRSGRIRFVCCNFLVVIWWCYVMLLYASPIGH